MRAFEGGASRDDVEGKPDYEGYLAPRVLKAYGAYMLKHQTTSDGGHRGSDNWQSGMPPDVWMKSAVRHLFDAWAWHRGPRTDRPVMVELLLAVLFNIMGYLNDLLKLDEDAAPVEEAPEEPLTGTCSYRFICGHQCGLPDGHLLLGGDGQEVHSYQRHRHDTCEDHVCPSGWELFTDDRGRCACSLKHW